MYECREVGECVVDGAIVMGWGEVCDDFVFVIGDEADVVAE